MKVAWFTEGGWNGKIPRNFEGMRNDSAWMCVLEATHFPINQIPQVNEKFDLGIVTIPKKNIDVLIKNLKNKNNEITKLSQNDINNYVK